MSITEDTVRMTDAQGHRVKGALRVHSHSVSFVPVEPLVPSLDDGSFRPDQEYVLEVVGFPHANAVRSAEGDVLDRTVAERFRAVSADARPSPLLHSQTSPFGFALDDRMQMAADSRTLALYFHESPMPTTVTTRAFKLHRLVDGSYEQFAPSSVKLHRLPRSYSGLPGWMIELRLDRSPGSYLCVEFSDEPEDALRDNTGGLPRRLAQSPQGMVEIVELVGQRVIVPVSQGMRVPLIQQDFSGPVRFHPARSGVASFEVDAGVAAPQVRVGAGSGRLGEFHPRGARS